MKKALVLLSILVFTAILCAQTHGGPDSYGYQWISSNDANGPVYNWITPDTTNGTVLSMTDDCLLGPFPIGFTFNFYGVDYTSVKISSNGHLTFNTTDSESRINQSVPNITQPNNLIGWFWSDLYPNDNTEYVPAPPVPSSVVVSYENTTIDGQNAFLVTYQNCKEYDNDDPGMFTGQVALLEDNTVLIQYKEFVGNYEFDLQSVCLENADGTIGLQCTYNDSTFFSNEMAIEFGFGRIGVINPSPEDGSTAVLVDGTLSCEFLEDSETYDLWFGPVDSMLQVVSGADVSSFTPYAFSDLRSESEYQWRVDVYDSASQIYPGSVWSFTTASGSIDTFPWNEDFSTWPPQDWTFDGDRTWVMDAASQHPYCSFWSWNGGVAQMITPYIDVPATGNYYLNFEWSHHYNDSYISDSLAVLVSSDGSNWTTEWARFGANFESGDGAGDQNPGTFVTASVNLSSFAGQTIRCNFYANSGWGPNLYFNSVSIEECTTVPSCASVAYPVQDTVNVGLDTLITWVGAEFADGYKLYFGTDNPPSNIEDGTDIGLVPEYLVSLSYETDYYWKIVPYNSFGDASGCPVWHFTSIPSPIISTFPHTESFAESVIPMNWSQSTEDSDNWSFTNTLEYSADSDHTGEGGNFMAFDDSGTYPDSASITTNPFDITALTNPILGFAYWIGDALNSDEEQSTLYIDILSGGTWNDGVSSFSYNGTWGMATVDLTPYSASDLTIRFRAIGSTSYYSDIAVDDVTVLDVSSPPGCTNLISPQDQFDNASAFITLLWAGSAGATGYKLSVGTDNPPTNLVNSIDVGDSVFHDLSSLSYSTTYYWQVVPYNNVGDASGCPVWSFTTFDDPTITSFPWLEDFEQSSIEDRNWTITGSESWAPHTENNNTSMFCNFYDWDEGFISHMTTPPIALTGTANLLFKWSRHHNTSYNHDTLKVAVSTDFANWDYLWVRADDQLDSDDGALDEAPGSFVQETINIDQYAGQTIYVRFTGFSGFGTNIYVDDVGIDITTPLDNDLSVITITGPLSPRAGMPSDYTVTVKNTGVNTQSTYAVKLMKNPDVELVSIPGTTIAPDSTLDFTLRWTPESTLTGNVNIFGKVILANDEAPANDNSAAITVDVQPSITGIHGYVRDSQGQPIDQASVVMDEQVQQVTDANGYYSFLNVSAGTHSCVASKDGYNDHTENNIAVTQDQMTEVNFTLGQGACLSGTVYDHANNPVSGALIVIDGLNEQTLSDEDGDYTFTQLTPGTYIVNTTKDGYMDQSNSNVVISAGATTPLDIILNEYGHLRVNVTSNLSSPNGASIELTDGTNTYQKTVEDSGRVIFAEIIPGTYTLTGSLTDCTPFEQQNLVIANGDNTPIAIALNELLIAPTNVRWDNDNSMLTWEHGDRIYGTRGNGDAALLEGEDVVNKNSQKAKERRLINFRVQVDMIDDTTSATSYVLSGFNTGDRLTATITAVYETGFAPAPNHTFTFGVSNDPEDVVKITELEGNYPNPFNPTTNIKFSLVKPGKVELVIYNIAGQKVKTLIDGEMAASKHNVEWNGKDDWGKPVSSGTYLYILKTKDYTKAKKMIMLK